MKRKVIDEFGEIEGFYCSRCGEPVWEDDDVCQTCGMNVSNVQESRTFLYDEPEDESLTAFFVEKVLARDGNVVCVELQEEKFGFLAKSGSPTFYILNGKIHIYLSTGSQINIDKQRLGYFKYRTDGYPLSWTFYYISNELENDDEGDYELNTISLLTEIMFKGFLENHGFRGAIIRREWSGDKDEY